MPKSKKKNVQPIAEASSFQRNVVLDTNVFKKNNFNFDAYPFKQLKERFLDDRASIYITEIVDHEVRMRMRRELEDAQKRFGAFRREARILFSAPGGALHKHESKLPLEDLVKSMSTAFDDFLGKLDATTIDCTQIPLGPVLKAFFDLEPPFGPGEEKRREFPDAISIVALADFFKGVGACVVSEDTLFQRACQQYKHLVVYPTLEDFLAAELADHEDVSWIVAAVNEQSEEVKEAITNAFEEGYFYLDDQEGDVEKVEVTELEMEDPVLVGTTQDEGTLSVNCHISYTADIAYDDPDMTIYSEGDRFSFGTVNEEIERDQWEIFTVRFQLNRLDKEISDFTSSSPASRGLSAVEYDE